MNKISTLVLLAVLLAIGVNAQDAQMFHLETLGIDKQTDATPAVVKALEICKDKGYRGITFPKGTYHFYPTFAPDYYCAITNNDNGLKRTPFPLINFNDFTIDGGGSEFIFHGKILPFIIENSKNITITNFSVDWEDPFYLQGIVVANDPNEKTFDINIVTPFKVESDRLYLKIERDQSDYEDKFGHRYAKQEKYHQRIGQNIIWDASTKAPIYNHNLYSGFENDYFFHATLLTGTTVRLKSKYKQMPPVGSVFISKGEYLFNRENPGFRVFKSENLMFKDINLYHAGAMGLIAERSITITLDNFNVVLKKGTSRLITTTADATHFCNCKGLITLKNCTFENMLDDATNIHGTYARVREVLNDNQVAYETYHPHQKGYLFGEKGDSVQIVDQKTIMPKSSLLIIKDIKRVNEKISVLTFDRSVKGLVQKYDGIENISWSASAIIQNNVVRNNRARGFLISTRKKVEVKNNFISSQMSAMLISGDLNLWNESGPCNDLVIENNQFVNNIYGGNKQAIISISPEQHLNEPAGKDTYHKNITIRNNEFKTFESAVLSAFSVDGLTFQGNKVIQTDAYKPLFPDKPNLSIRSCSNVVVRDNTYLSLSGKTSALTIQMEEPVQQNVSKTTKGQ